MSDSAPDSPKVRDPIPSKRMVLLEDAGTGTGTGTYEEELMKQFNKFKVNIRSDTRLTGKEKFMLINNARKEMESKIKYHEESKSRTKIIIDLKVRLSNSKLHKINSVWAKNILEKIKNWENCTVDKIILDSESLYSVYKIIDESNTCSTPIKSSVKNIFEPYSLEDYLVYSNIMDNVLLQSVEDQKRVLEQKMIEEQRERELRDLILERGKLLEEVIKQMNKISIYDSQVKVLKDEITDSLNKYINLHTEHLIFNEITIYQKFVQFVKSIRLEQNIKDNILQICICEE